MAFAPAKQNSVAIVVDEKSYEEARGEVDAYALAIERQGLETVLILDHWQHPDSIRVRLKKLYQSSQMPLEGVIFIGDIPVPMLRDAQHLSTAFKMDQDKFAWTRSSIPSDRFYDDLDLEFEYLKQDSVQPLYHYYSLKAESPQRLSVDIYSARIKPPHGPNQYELLRNYLKKVVAFKENPPVADQVMFFTGHGYNSECPRTWMDEKLALSQQFAYMNGQKNYLEYINFQFDQHVKFRLMAELKRTDLDIALLHHHGGPNSQYLDGMPETGSVQDQIRDVKYYLRSKLRSANKSPEKLEEAKNYFKKSLGVSDAWFEGAIDKVQEEEDSVFNAKLDINIEDMAGYSSNVPFIMIDACFTGSFHRDKYIAGEYLFDEGKTIAVQANSVNVFQDKWGDEMVGLLGLGLRVGYWHKMNCSLETHLLGDPTMMFAQRDKNVDLNNWMEKRAIDRSFWKKQLSSPYADVEALALRMLYQIDGIAVSDLLLDQFKNNTFYSVRAEALKLLRMCKDNNFIQALNLGMTDSYELIQRFSPLYMSETGHPSHVPYIIDAMLRNNTSKRVAYNLKEAAGMYNKDVLLAELDRQIERKEFLLDKDETYQQIRKSVEYGCNRMRSYIDELVNAETKEKDQIFNLRAFRNQTIHQHLEELISFIDTTSNTRLKLAGVELLGWFDHSYKRNLITDFCEKALNDKSITEELKNELIKTKNRIN